MMLYAKIAAIAIALGLAYWKGYDTMKDKHLLFVAEVKRVGEAQELANQNAIEMAEVITESVKENYETQIANLRRRYASSGGVCHTNPNSGKVSAVPKPTSGTYDPSTDSKLIVNCAETTAQLTALQNWVKKQSEVGK